MGVRGLTSFSQSIGISEGIHIPLANNQFSSALVIDGSALVHYIFQQCIRTRANCLYGDSVALISYTKAFFNLLRAAGFHELYVILDGASVPEKIKTEIKREKQKIGRLNRIALFMMPSFLYEPFVYALKESNVWFRTCAQEEADIIVANLAFSLNAMVLSNDSDFLIFPSRGYICLRDFYIPDFLIKKFSDPNYEPINIDYLILNVYHPTRLAQHFQFSPRWLPLFACITGNDFRNGMAFNKKASETPGTIKKIANAIKEVEREFSEDIHIDDVKDEDFIDKVLEKLNIPQRLTDDLMKHSEFYYLEMIEDFHIDKWLSVVDGQSFDSKQMELFHAVESGLISRKLAPYANNYTFFCSVYPTPGPHKSPWEITVVLRKFLFSLLEILRGKSSDGVFVTEYRRVSNDFKAVTLEIMTMLEMEQMCGHWSPFPTSFSEMKKIPEQARIEVLCKIFDMDISLYSYELFPVIAVLKFVASNIPDSFGNLSSDHPFINAVIASIIMATREPVPENEEAVDFFTRLNFGDRPWIMAFFQNVLHHYIMIIDCLCLENVNHELLHSIYNGSFIHHFWNELEDKDNEAFGFVDYFPSLKQHENDYHRIVEQLKL